MKTIILKLIFTDTELEMIINGLYYVHKYHQGQGGIGAVARLQLAFMECLPRAKRFVKAQIDGKSKGPV